MRSTDGGAADAIVLVARGGGLSRWVAGLWASVTASHLLGPFIARRLDTARDGRKVLAIPARTLRLVLRCGPLRGAADRLRSALAVLAAAAVASIVDRSRPI